MKKIISENDVHAHLAARMRERGITLEEINVTLEHGWPAGDVKEGICGKVHVFAYEKEWVGKVFAEKEVSVYYKVIDSGVMLLTAKARYGTHFRRKESIHEV